MIALRAAFGRLVSRYLENHVIGGKCVELECHRKRVGVHGREEKIKDAARAREERRQADEAIRVITTPGGVAPSERRRLT